MDPEIRKIMVGEWESIDDSVPHKRIQELMKAGIPVSEGFVQKNLILNDKDKKKSGRRGRQAKVYNDHIDIDFSNVGM